MLQTNRYMLMLFVAFLSTQLSGAVQDDSSQSQVRSHDVNHESAANIQERKNDDSSSYQQTAQDAQLDNASTLSDTGDSSQPQLINEPMEYQWPTSEADMNIAADGSFLDLTQSMYIE